jgi:hypothetical protein
MVNGNEEDRRHDLRKPVDAKVEFCIEGDINEANSVNISENGVAFDMNEPIEIFLKMYIEDRLISRKARLVWADRKKEGGMNYGFEYLPD